MKTIKTLSILTTLLLLLCNCTNNDPIAPTGNTNEYFKYTVDNGTEQIFDFRIESHIETSTNSPNITTYEFNAVAQTNNTNTTTGATTKRLSGAFSFGNETDFFNNASYNWGLSDGTNVRFYFSSIDNGLIIPNNQPINCTISLHPTNINDYIEFSFSGNYTDDTNNNHTIQGEARIKRSADQNL